MKITKRSETLPERIEKLKNFIAIRRREITAYRAKLRAMKDIGMVEEEQKRVLNEAQNKAEEVLGAEAEMGGMIEKIPDGVAKVTDRDKKGRIKKATKEKLRVEKGLPLGVNLGILELNWQD